MESFNLTYKQRHEKFMQNHTGTSVEETVLVLTPVPLTIFLSVFFVKCFKHSFAFKNSFSDVLLFIFEFIVLVFPHILIFMIPNYTFICYVIIGCSACLSFAVVVKCMKQIEFLKESTISLRKIPLIGNRPYIIYFRSSVNLITTICILAVDFKAFPRKFAKTEIYGYSVMDTGVGFFTICNGIVGRHLFKNELQTCNRLDFLFKQMKRNSVLLILGLIRIISTKSVDYQNHFSEYGVHWNFFITLAFTKLVSSTLLTFIDNRHLKFLAVFVILVHQFMLSFGLQEWILSDTPRNNLINANREGIVSLFGYIGLYLISVEVGNRFNFKTATIETEAKLIMKLFFSVFLLYVSILFFENYVHCSRRLANITFILWINMLTLYLLGMCLLFELILRFCNGTKNLKDNEGLVPIILLSINFNGLLYFLLANLLTGITNLSVETIYVSEIYSIFILTIYMLLNCSIAVILYKKLFKLL